MPVKDKGIIVTFTDRQLLDYLNGSASPDVAEAIEAALAEDKAFEDRLLSLDPLSDLIGPSIASVGTDRTFPEPASSKPPFWPLLAAGLAAAVVAGTIGFWWSGATPENRGWMDQVAAYQALYSAETISIVTPEPMALASQFDHVAETLGRAIPLNVVRDATDLTLLRAQMLAFEDTPLAQIVFSDGTGQPVALCVIHASGPASDTFTSVERDGLHSTSFSLDGLEYLLIGGASADQTETLARQFQAALSDA